MTRSPFLIACLAALVALAPPLQAQEARRLDITTTARTGDFDTMLERRAIRVNVPFSRTLYYVDKGTERGYSAEMVRDFERWLNTRHAKQLGKRPLTVFVIVATRDKLFTNLREGHADIAVGALGVTSERDKLVDFVSPPDMPKAREILVTGPQAPPIASVDDLSGKRIHVRKSSTYHESLVALNQRFSNEGKPPAILVLVPEALEDDDMMEMTNAGLVDAMVTADWAARLWAPVLPKLQVHDDIALRGETGIGWAIREGSPQLAAEINEFYASWIKKQRLVETRLAQHMKRIKQIRNPTRGDDYTRFQQTVALFEKYGEQYGFDPLMLAAQGYQESRLDQKAKSPVGAIGVMQLMPATGEELKVGDVRVTEPNIHAGAKYMDRLLTRYFADAHFTPQDRTLFAFASYNAGPGNMSKMRKEAARRGLDPDVWFNNVEIVTAEKIGIETTTYVRNIFKYYVAYKLETTARAELERAKKELAPAGK